MSEHVKDGRQWLVDNYDKDHHDLPSALDALCDAWRIIDGLLSAPDTTGDEMGEDIGPYPQPQEFGEWPKGIEDVGFNMPDAEHVAGVCQQIRAVALDVAAVADDTKQAGITLAQLRRALKDATAWAEDGYSDVSRSYWAGMRDTLRVVLGETTRPPLVSSDDAAAYTLLRGQR